MDKLINHLINPINIYSRSQALHNNIPQCPGLYAWFFKEIPPRVPTNGCITKDDLTLLYIGISPTKPPVKKVTLDSRNLRKRIRDHYFGNAEGSTLRLTLGCLLSDELGIELRRIGNGYRMTFTKAGEEKLSDWMNQNAFVTWIEHPEPWKLEGEAIRSLVLPLNLKDNEVNEFSKTLSEIRSKMRLKAKELPVVTV